MSPRLTRRLGRAAAIAAVALAGIAPSALGTGTLRVGAESDPDSLDPAMAYAPGSWQILANTGGGLLAFAREPGADGARVVPLLARAMPQRLAGGRLLRFRIRPGIRFGPPSGRVVRASDVKASIERLFRHGSPGRGLYRGIAGAARFERGSAADISGIVADDRTGRLDVRLTRVDGGILAALALPFADVVPAETDTSASDRPPASLGPYYVRGYRQGEFVDLAPNPYYAATAALPAGRPDRIVVRLGLEEDEIVSAIASGSLDATQDRIPAATLEAAGLPLRRSVELASHVIVLNTRTPPFGDIRVRRAVAAALDRDRLAAALGDEGVPSASLIPPSLPGATTEPAPEPAPGAARDVIATTGATGSPVTVWASVEEPGPAVARRTALALTGLGLAAVDRVVPREDLLGRLGEPDGGVQIAHIRLRNDLPDPGNTLRLAFAGEGADRRSLNFSRLDDPVVDRLIARAVATWGTEARAAAWSRVADAAVRRAVVIPFAAPIKVEPVASRVGGYVAHPLYGFLWMQAEVPA